MKTIRTRLNALLTVAGVVEIMVGALHFAMPAYYNDSTGLGNLSGADADFVTLVTYATGILLVAFGLVTLGVRKLIALDPNFVVAFLAVKTALWLARLTLEVLYPVDLPMFGIAPFTLIVTPGLIAEASIFAIATATAYQLRKLSSESSQTTASSR